jgi:aminoglycoside phosphotransferase (APT) family kinase protein
MHREAYWSQGPVNPRKIEAVAMLDVESIVPYLLERGLIQRRWILEGSLTIRSAARRNRNLRVEGPDGIGCFIKQPDELSPASRRTLACEASYYEFCQREELASAIACLMPRMILHDRDRSLYALELIPGAMTLAAHRTARSYDHFPVAASRALGTSLGTLHRLFRLPGLADDPRLSWLSRPVPAFLRATRPAPALLANMSPAAARVVRILQAEAGLDAALHELAQQWSPETVIHGDIRSDNVLVGATSDPANPDGIEIRLVDWEFVHIGDPAWDLAGAFQDDLVFWTSTMPQEPELSPQEMISRANYPLDVIRPAIRALWSGYLASAGLDNGGNVANVTCLLRRAVAFSAARLIMTAHELSAERDELPVQAVLLLQIAANLLADPARGQEHLYGIPCEAGQG